MRVEKTFSKEGELAQLIPGYAPREEQIQMASAVAKSFEDKSSLMVEAGTGTGKTYAYLVPALKSKGKVIVSTGTKNLQEQLYLRDLPLIKKALSSHKSVALLKGRANYLCLYRLGQNTRQNNFLDSSTLAELALIKKWSTTTKSGDIGELDSIPEDASALPFVTSTVDNCLGRDCPDYEDCYLVKARKLALESDVVVVNHHLFFADLSLKDIGFGELIPEAEAIVFDEAHQIPDIATEYFGENVSGRQIQDLCRDIEVTQKTALKDAAQLSKAAEKLKSTVAEFRLFFPEQPQKGNWLQQLRRNEIAEHCVKIKDAMDIVYEVFKVHLGREKTLDALFEKLATARSRFKIMLNDTQSGMSLWYETTPKHIVLHATPLDVAEKFSAIMEQQKRAWVFTSATMAVGKDFSHFQRQLGLDSAKALILSSPFDYQKQAMLCVPRYLPDAHMREKRAALIDIAKQFIEASGGGCFLLFTSHAMMRQVAKDLEEQIDNPLLVQGVTSKRELLQQFISNDDAVLLATGAFWEGVDVRGDKLTCVIIDKLPFASPDDPLLQAKMDERKKKGENPFASMQIPQAVITLKQGAGRLIRDTSDFGVLVICDHRLVNKDYGSVFLDSLPNMQRTRSVDTALEFLTEIKKDKFE